MLTASTSIFAASDIEETLRFYKEVLGFQTSWTWGEPPVFGGANWGKIMVMFCLEPELAAGVEGHQHWFNVEDVNALYELHVERGAMILSPIEDKPWSVREYTVRDINGYHLRFCGDPAYASKGTGQFPEGVQIISRRPALDEYLKVAGGEFPVREETLSRTWGGVVALSPDGEAIGVVRIMYDSPGWFSIWDVAVLPEWQGQRIGTAMMETAMETIRREWPGAFVYLFTFKHEFYARLGFAKESVDSRRV